MGYRVAVIASLILSVFCYRSGLGGTTGKIAGTVKDASTGETIPGVNIILEGTTMGAASDMEGRYFVINVPPGTYSVVASAIGYTSVRKTSVAVSVDLTTTVDFELSPTVLELGEEVVITAERPLVKKDLTSVEGRVTAEQIESMPVQEFGDVLNLQSGVTVDRFGGLHIRGGRTSEIAYWVDGVSVTDVYDNSAAIIIENNFIQEVQVISGTYNAEYGNAMSGIINVVTREGGRRYEGSVSGFVGDYLSSDGDIFDNIGDRNATANRNLQASLGGPVPGFGSMFTFYANIRYYHTDGWLYGQRRFLTDGSTGDEAPVRMNWRTKWSGQAKLSYRFSSTLKLNLNGLGSTEDYRDYSHDFRMNPDGDVNKFNDGYNLNLDWTHTLSPSTFYTVDLSRSYKEFEEYLYENPLDSRYKHPDMLNRGAFNFIGAGTNLHRFNRVTRSSIAKFDLTSQVTNVHQVRLGVEGKLHRLFLDEVTITPKNDPTGQQIMPFQPEILDPTTPVHDLYNEGPIEFSGYIQDKIEYESMIINIGLRFDYFDSRGMVLADPSDPNIYNPFKQNHQALTLEQRREIWYKDASAKYQVSPRFGIAYPITDRGVLHFSYGHFLQIPNLQFLYVRPEFKVTTGSGVQGVFGNADLDPQKTVMYEFGLQQQLFDDLSFDVTAFYRDVRNWVTAGPTIETAIAGVGYTTYINRDYANVRGVTLTVHKRQSNYYSFDLSYTFQNAEGTNSSPEEEFFSARGGREPTKALSALEWDQRHTVNASFLVGEAGWGVGLIGRYGSGLPYTPTIVQATRQGQNVFSGLRKNSRRKPDFLSLDLRLYKRIPIAGTAFTLFANIYNVLDRRNEVEIFTDTGKADQTLQAINITQEDVGNNTLTEFFTRPDFYSEPREVQLGIEFSF